MTKIDLDNLDDFDWKLRGFCNMPREIILRMIKGEIDFDQLGLLTIYVANADWDYRHKKYATCELSNNELARKIRGLSRDRIKIAKYSLCAKKFIGIERLKNNKEIITIKNPKQYFTDRLYRNKTTLPQKKE